jgi:hypothetical protein
VAKRVAWSKNASFAEGSPNESGVVEAAAVGTMSEAAVVPFVVGSPVEEVTAAGKRAEEARLPSTRFTGRMDMAVSGTRPGKPGTRRVSGFPRAFPF